MALAKVSTCLFAAVAGSAALVGIATPSSAFTFAAPALARTERALADLDVVAAFPIGAIPRASRIRLVGPVGALASEPPPLGFAPLGLGPASSAGV